MSLLFLLHKLSRKKAKTFFLDQSQSRAKIQTIQTIHSTIASTHTTIKFKISLFQLVMYRLPNSLGNIIEYSARVLQNIQTKFFPPDRVEL